VYSAHSSKSTGTHEPLEETLLRSDTRLLSEKVRRLRQITERRPGAMVGKLHPALNRLPLINDPDGTELKFHITTEMFRKIEIASARFAAFEKTRVVTIGVPSPPRKRKKGINERKEGEEGHKQKKEDLVGGADMTTAPKHRIGRENPVVLFHKLLKHVLKGLVEREDDEYWMFKERVKWKDAPDYFEVVGDPISFADIYRAIEKMEYTSVEQFSTDVELIASNCKLYNQGKNPGLIALADKLLADFRHELEKVADKLARCEGQMDHRLRRDE
jgi:hypothetical protein